MCRHVGEEGEKICFAAWLILIVVLGMATRRSEDKSAQQHPHAHPHAPPQPQQPQHQHQQQPPGRQDSAQPLGAQTAGVKGWVGGGAGWKAAVASEDTSVHARMPHAIGGMAGVWQAAGVRAGDDARARAQGRSWESTNTEDLAHVPPMVKEMRHVNFALVTISEITRACFGKAGFCFPTYRPQELTTYKLFCVVGVPFVVSTDSVFGEFAGSVPKLVWIQEYCQVNPAS